jgi:hypothetical protein
LQADENDRAVLDGLERARLYRDVDRLGAEQDPPADEQAGTQPQVMILHDRAGECALRIAVADRRHVGNFGLDIVVAVLRIDHHGVADVNALQIAPIDREVDPDGREVGNDEGGLLV